jgi:broad-specificity NMP kinase
MCTEYKRSVCLMDEIPILLTENQEKVMKQCITVLPHFKIIVMKGEAGVGKHTICKEIFQQLNAVVEYFDICDYISTMTTNFTNQDLIKYFELLSARLTTRMKNVSSKRNYDDLSEDFSNFSLHDKKKSGIGIIYIRNYHLLDTIFSDCNTKLRFILPLLFKKLSETLPHTIHILITTHGCILPEILHSSLELKSQKTDIEPILSYFLKTDKISSHEYKEMITLYDKISIGQLLFCLKYAFVMRDQDTTFLECYKQAVRKFCLASVDRENVPTINVKNDLIGMDSILEEIKTSIIIPMKLGIEGLSIKKGLILCGPPGTGKTSIGRWLSHELHGKLFLVNDGSHFETIIQKFSKAIYDAKKNAPAVVFIDDGDILFSNEDTYRGFLTILDGIENNKRSNVCVVLTCMNLKNIPESLLRGGRLELLLLTTLPNQEKIQLQLQSGLQTMCDTLALYDKHLANSIKNMICSEVIADIAIRMNAFNYADIQRCMNDIARQIISLHMSNPATKYDLYILFNKNIKSIREQYELCTKCESTSPSSASVHNSYIM